MKTFDIEIVPNIKKVKIDPDKEAIFIIQDSKQMSLIHYKKDCEGASFKMM